MDYICYDCGKVLTENDQAAAYDCHSGVQFKCLDCYDKEPFLKIKGAKDVYSREVGEIKIINEWAKTNYQSP